MWIVLHRWNMILPCNLTNLQRSQPPRVAILSSVLKPSNMCIRAHPGLSIISDLKRQYDVSILPYFADGFDEQYDVLIIFDAPIIRQAMVEAIDNHHSARQKCHNNA
jgi:hypothetical protein